MVTLKYKKVLLRRMQVAHMESKTYFTTTDIALVSVFCALWVSLNLTLGPLGFTWFKLPILCDFSVFFTLLLVTWVTGRFGTASLVGIIGSLIVLMIRPSPHIIGFAVSAILFDILMLANHYKIHVKAYNLTVAALATMISAYFAGVIIGIFFSNKSLTTETLQWALTFWGGWHLVGGIISVVITLPIIGVLEKANVRKIKSV
jgi:hypothetical protein